MPQVDKMTASGILYKMSGVPVFQNVIYPTADKARSVLTGDVCLVQCPDTGLVYNAAFDSDLVDYDAGYQNEQALSPTFQAHLESTLDLLCTHFIELSSGVEIGCGKGHFLEMALDRELTLTGYDPAYQGTNPRVVREYFQAGIHQPDADYFVLRHVLEHIQDPWSFLQHLSEGVKSSCLVYIEVPAFEWIIENDAFYDVFYEHCNYFTRASLAGKFGSVRDSGYCFGGQYLYVIADLSTFSQRRSFDGELYEGLVFSERIERTLVSLSNGRRNYIWGAGAKGVTMSNLLLERSVAVEAIVDINPAKQGGYVGKSAIPVLSPEAAIPQMEGGNVLIMNPNYAAEIAAQLDECDVNQVAVI